MSYYNPCPLCGANLDPGETCDCEEQEGPMAKTKSIFTDDFKTCYLTGLSGWIEKHHIFGGACRRFSEQYGLVIPVQHHYHNEPPYGIHHNKALDLAIKKYAQRKFEEEHSREEFMLIFGRNYLDGDEDGYEISLRKLGIPLPDVA